MSCVNRIFISCRSCCLVVVFVNTHLHESRTATCNFGQGPSTSRAHQTTSKFPNTTGRRKGEGVISKKLPVALSVKRCFGELCARNRAQKWGTFQYNPTPRRIPENFQKPAQPTAATGRYSTARRTSEMCLLHLHS